MPCLLAVLALITPRILVAYLFFFTQWLHTAFNGELVWPIVGFFVAPTSLLWYSVVQNHYGGVWDTMQIVLMVFAVLIDLSPGAGKSNKR